ncbi:MAG: hypothetical protein SOU82_02345 [Alloprevotella sp.]|nr:hypothetical protein [Alloprevotella sp.]
MKRLKLFLGLVAALFMAVTGSMAQTPTAGPISSEEIPEGYYFIASTKGSVYGITNPYIAANGGSMKLVPGTAVTTNLLSSKVGIWKISIQDANTTPKRYKIQSIENGLYWDAGPGCPLGTSNGHYEIRQSPTDNSVYTFNGVAGGIGNSNSVNATSATSFNRDNNDTYNTWKLIPAGFSEGDFKTLTISCTYGEGEGGTFSKSFQGLSGNEITFSDFVDFYTNFTPSSYTFTSEANQNLNVTCEEKFPIEWGKFYKLKIREFNAQVKDQPYVVWTPSETNVGSRKAETANMNGYWRFKKVPGTENKVIVYSNAQGKSNALTFENFENNRLATLSENGTQLAIRPITPSGNTSSSYTTAGCFRLANPANDNENLHDVKGKIGIWNNALSKTDVGSTFTFVEVTPQPTALTTAKVIEKTNDITEIIDITLKDYYWDGNDDVSAIELTNQYSILTKSSTTKDQEGYVVFNVTNNPPFTISPDEEHLTYQYLRTRNDDSHYLVAAYDEGTTTSGKTQSRLAVSKSSLSSMQKLAGKGWAMVKKPGTLNQYYLYNEATDKLKLTLDNNEQGTKATMTETGTPFFLNRQPAEFTGFTGGFTIQPDNTNNHAVGDHNNNGELSYWSNRGSSELNDGGSIFRVVDEEEMVNACKSIISKTGFAGSFTSSVIAELNGYPTLKAFFIMYDMARSMGLNSYEKVDPNKFYRIYFKRSTQYVNNSGAYADANGTVSEDEASRDLLTVNSENVEANVSTICNFVATGTEGVYNIQNPNSKFWWGTTKAAEQTKLYTEKEQQDAGKYSVVYGVDFNDVPCVLIKDTEITQDWKYLASHFDGEYNKQIDNRANVTAGGELEPAVAIYIKEVTSYPVTFKAQYATLTLPFDVTIPTDVKAYVASGVNTSAQGVRELTLTEVTTTIPANTPVVLECTAAQAPTAEATATYKFPLTNTVTSYDGTNLLSPTTVRRTGLTANTYYGLSIGADETVGFNISAITSVPANKAYLTKASLSALEPQPETASFIRCNFGGETTGLDNINTTNEDSNIYYDLNGRRVLYPSTGIYVKGNGQKVFIQ